MVRTRGCVPLCTMAFLLNSLPIFDYSLPPRTRQALVNELFSDLVNVPCTHRNNDSTCVFLQEPIANVVKCRPPDNRRPLPEEASACLPFLRKQIAFVAPRWIVLLGATALRAVGRGWLKHFVGNPLEPAAPRLT